MSGADDAREAVQTVLSNHRRWLNAAMAEFTDNCVRAAATSDIVEAFTAAADVIMAIQHLAKLAEQSEQQIREVLAGQMMETGCFHADGTSLSVTLTRKRATVDITDAAAIPEVYKRQPPPAPDKRTILHILERGGRVPGATLVRPNDYYVMIRPKKD